MDAFKNGKDHGSPNTAMVVANLRLITVVLKSPEFPRNTRPRTLRYPGNPSPPCRQFPRARKYISRRNSPRRRERRAFTVDELLRLITAAHNGPDRGGITGSARALLYRLAVETGLCASELRRLTRASFDLGGDPPTVTVAAAYSKHRRNDTLPLRPDTADLIHQHVATKAPAARVFNIPMHRRDSSAMFKADRDAAGIAERDDADRVADFHALRHTFISNLAAAGAHPKVAQSLARHSTITLTMDRYTHQYAGREVEAIGLPDLSQTTADAAKATGTNDVPVGHDPPQQHPRLKPHQRGRESARSGATQRDDDDKRGRAVDTAADERKPLCHTIQRDDVRCKKAERVGFEPTVTRTPHRFSRPAP